MVKWGIVMEFLNGMDLSSLQWVSLIIASALFGFSKTGIGGTSMLAVPILAAVFGGKVSTGLILPLLLVGDVFAISYYRKHAKWSDIRKLMLWNCCGLLLGTLVGNYINDIQFKALIGLSVIVCLAILVYSEMKGDDLKVPEKTWVYVLFGILCGFTSMIGNAAGPIFSIFLLAKGFKKNSFMGTTSWFFFINNLIKVPLQVFVWHNISSQTVMLAGFMIPAIAAGALLGIVVIKRINEKHFRYTILAMTAIAAMKLFI